MNLSIALIFLPYLMCAYYANITFNAKFMGNWRVSGDSVVLHALSISHCLAMCNKNATCDAITFYDRLRKCRLFKRCKPLLTLNKSSHHWFYAKRPPITSPGYNYEDQSDSCLAVKNDKIPYEDVDNICAQDRAYAAVLSTPKLLDMADQMLRKFDENEAWINPPYRAYEKFSHNREIQKKPKILMDEENGESVKQCWLLRGRTPVKISPCFPENKFTICQLPTY